MSVVNRMLQDIDDRRRMAGVDVLGANADIRSVAAQPDRPARSGRRVWIAALLIGACATVAIAAMVLREWNARPLTNAVPQLPATVRATVPAATPPAQVAGSGVPQTEPVATVPVAPAPIEQPATHSPAVPRNTTLPSAETLKLSLKLSALVAETPSVRSPAKVAPAAIAAPSGTTTIVNVPIRRIAVEETVAVARALWNDRSRTAALATLREALAVAETARDNRATQVLALELARLEVADNRAQVALDLLKRLEPLLGEEADMWALRGNAAQRLAMHAEAAESYLAALRLRPTEGKWMLGAAISLAAGGKLDEAQTWVERASERDAVTPTIAAYLRELGIVARR